VEADEFVDEAVRVFRHVVVSSWSAIEGISARDRTGSFRADWLQANWESIVEAGLAGGSPIYLQPYGNGADCNPRSSRVWRPDAIPTHEIVCAPKGDGTLYDELTKRQLIGSVALEKFGTIVNGYFVEASPFDRVKLDGSDATLPVDGVTFGCVEVALI
jgi:hypothetical protein